MSKRKLTIRQSATVSKQQQKHLSRAQSVISREEESTLGAEQTGLLIASFGVEAEVESGEGKRYRCKIRQNLGTLVVGDRVVWRIIKDDTGIIEAVMPRRTLLDRPIKDGKSKAIAANVDQVIIVIAPQPKPASNLLDSYLVAIELLKLQPVIVCNKIDLFSPEEKAEFAKWLFTYQQLNYPIFEVSAAKQQGIAELNKQLQQHTSIFVGQSGVGKSSLLHCLLPAYAIRIGAATEHVHGLHTTTASRLYHLPQGGDIIDSPGIRDFILWDMTPAEIAKGFKEFHDYLGQCKFRDCDHLQTPGCALQQAVQKGSISEQRYNSYQRVVEFLANIKR